MVVLASPHVLVYCLSFLPAHPCLPRPPCCQAVLHELDRKKGGDGRCAYDARAAARALKRVADELVYPAPASTTTTAASSSAAPAATASAAAPGRYQPPSARPAAAGGGGSTGVPAGSYLSMYRGQALHEVLVGRGQVLEAALARLQGGGSSSSHGGGSSGYPSRSDAPNWRKPAGGDGGRWGGGAGAGAGAGRQQRWGAGGSSGGPGGGKFSHVLHRYRNSRELAGLRDNFTGSLPGDDGILDCCMYFNKKGHHVNLVTGDKLFQLRAGTEGLLVTDLDSWRRMVQAQPPSFWM